MLLDVLNVAVTWVFAVRVSAQDGLLLQLPPVHPAKVDPCAGVAVRVTCVPESKGALQVVPQLMPAGELVTVPDPVPASVTVNATALRENVAVTEVLAFNVMIQGAVPVHAPPQPVKVDPDTGVAVNVTWVPLS